MLVVKKSSGQGCIECTLKSFLSLPTIDDILLELSESQNRYGLSCEKWSLIPKLDEETSISLLPLQCPLAASGGLICQGEITPAPQKSSPGFVSSS